MRKGTGKVALEKKATPLFEKTFIFFWYRMVIDVQDIFAAVFHNINAPRRWRGGGGCGWINNKYRVLNNSLNAKKTQYSVASNYILICHTDHYNV